MNKIPSICLFFCLTFSVTSLQAKIYFGQSSEKIKKKGLEFTLKQIDSSQDFKILKSQRVSFGSSLFQTFSPSEKYLVVYLARKKKKHDELVVYSTANFEEIFRTDVGKFPRLYLGAFVEPIFNEEETLLAVQIVNKKKHFLNGYNLTTEQLDYSVALEKKAFLIGQSKSKKTLYVGGKAGMKGHKSINIFDIHTGEQLQNYASKYVWYNYKPEIDKDLFVKKYKVAKNHKHEIIVFDSVTGAVSYSQKVGYNFPVFAKPKDTNYFYFANLSKKEKGFDISQYDSGNVQIISHSDEYVKPRLLIVNNKENGFLVSGKGRFVVLDAEQSVSSTKISTPFDIASGFYSNNDALIYLREGTGSEVAVFDVNSLKIVGSSGVGRASVKFGQFLATVALGAATGYYSGYMTISYKYSDTAMLLSRDQARLYVINAKTNDVTLFNAKDMSGRKGIATGGGTFGVFQLLPEYYPDEKDSNVFVLSPRSVSYFNSSSNEVVNKIDFDLFINLDFEKNLLFTSDKAGKITIHRLSTGESIATINQSENIESIVYKIR